MKSRNALEMVKSTSVEVRLAQVISTLDNIIEGNYYIRNDTETIVIENNEENYRTYCKFLCDELFDIVINQECNIKLCSLDRLAQYQRVLSLVFYNSGYGSADFLIDHIIKKNNVISGERLITAYCFLTTESKKFNEFKAYIAANPDLYLTTCLTQIWATSQTHQSLINREMAYLNIESLANKHKDLTFPVSTVAGYYMHSSYGFGKRKHQLKAIVYEYIARNCPRQTVNKLDEIKKDFGLSDKTRLFVVIDHFSSYHSVYRVLGMSIMHLKSKFHITAVIHESMAKIAVTDFFDAKIIIKSKNSIYDFLDQLADHITKFKPYTILYPGVGMSPWTIYLSAFRLAPLQIASLGHAASTNSPEIDYFITDEDFSGSKDAYTETLLCSKVGSMSFVEPQNVVYPLKRRNSSQEINICINGSHMKINSAILKIYENLFNAYHDSKFKVNFHLFVYGLNYDLHGLQFRTMVKSYVPSCILNYSQSFADYLDKFSEMDIVLNPFPYGNMNSLIDSFKLGVIPICMIGSHPHENIDSALINRVGLSSLLITHNFAEYESVARLLIEDSILRESIFKQMKNINYDSIFTGDCSGISDTIEKIISIRSESL